MEKRQWWLVVGDGNFSFSLSLLKTASHLNLITSTLLSRSDDPEIIQNVASLERMGVVVLHEVDGTHLSQCTYLRQHCPRFDVIVFNFPHTGGKSNIKQNRELISGFFKSGAQFLNSDGEIHVTLCKGQGGTSMDCTKRGYENSWKIVEMAASANLLLAGVEPFPSALYPSYEPTGYRGLGKGFSLEGAMKHVFRFPQIDHLHWFMSTQGLHVCETCTNSASSDVIVPAELQDAVNYPLLSHPWHPVVQVKNILVGHLKNSLHHDGWVGCVDVPHIQIHQIPSPCVPNHMASAHETVVLHCPNCKLDACDSPCTGAHNDDIHTGHAFFTSLELDIPRLASQMCVSEKASLPLVCSPVVHNVEISLGSSAQLVSHELMGIIQLKVGESSQRLEVQLTKLLDGVLRESPGLPQEVAAAPHAHLWDCVPGTYVDEWKVLSIGGYGNIAKLGAHSTGMNMYFVFIFLLESLAMLHYGISDVRLMRSKDVHFSAQFVGHPVLKYAPFCLSCPYYKHDISFWHIFSDNCLSKVRQKLSFAIKQIAGGIVIDLTCLDVYHNPDGNNISYCFRVTYNHYDQPLSKAQSNILQLMIREALSRDPEITLR